MKLIKNLLVALVLMTAAWRLDASTVVQLNFDELSRASNSVVAGQVIGITADRDANGYIYSTVTIRVAEAVPQTLVGTDYVFRMIGGTLNGQSTFIEGMPKFAVGDGLILETTFLVDLEREERRGRRGPAHAFLEENAAERLVSTC